MLNADKNKNKKSKYLSIHIHVDLNGVVTIKQDRKYHSVRFTFLSSTLDTNSCGDDFMDYEFVMQWVLWAMNSNSSKKKSASLITRMGSIWKE